MLFKLFMMHILNMKLEVREQFEIMYVKCVLKPVISRIQFLNRKQKEAEATNENEN